MTTQQLSFKIPNTFTKADVPIEQIIIEEEIEGSLCKSTCKSVEHLGLVFQDVVLVKFEGLYKIVVGRRRIKASKDAGLSTVPALVFDAGTPQEILDTITVVENMTRTANPAVEAERLDRIMAVRHWSAQDVFEHLGIPASMVKSRLALFKLLPEFFARLKKGEITFAVARVLCKLPDEKQRELLGEEKLTMDVVQAVLRDKRLSGLLPAELFKLPEAPKEDPVEALVKGAIASIERAIQITTNGRRGNLEQALKALKED